VCSKRKFSMTRWGTPLGEKRRNGVGGRGKERPTVGFVTVIEKKRKKIPGGLRQRCHAGKPIPEKNKEEN